MIRIVNWLLTRKCNLTCDYCAIVKNYTGMPYQYPQMKHYIQNEMPTDVVLNALTAFKKHNKNTFHIFYGGEPLLRKDLPLIINHCNESGIPYTIISNNTPEIQPMIERLFKETDYVEGFTSSVDPIFHHNGYASADRITKSVEGLRRLKEIQARGDVKDVVAEITVMNENQHMLIDLLRELSKHEIYSDITFVDIAKSEYYDFSNVTNDEMLVQPSWELAQSLSEIMMDDDLLIHMKDILIPRMYDTLPSNFDCLLERSVHNVTVDADGTMRLCLRIKGTLCPNIHVSELFDSYNLVHKDFYDLMCVDKRRLCQRCNHSCLMMSQYIDEHGDGEDELVHSDKRGIK